MNSTFLLIDIWYSSPFCCYQGNPATPEGPIEVSDVTAESCRLTWQAPADDGGSPITNYTVEKREVGEDYWSKVSSFIMDPEFVVPKLNKGTEYEFRVRAENQHGANSPNLMSEPVLAKNPYGMCLFFKLFALIMKDTTKAVKYVNWSSEQ